MPFYMCPAPWMFFGFIKYSGIWWCGQCKFSILGLTHFMQFFFPPKAAQKMTEEIWRNQEKKMKMGTKGSFWYTFWNWHYVEWLLLLIGCSRNSYTDPINFKIFKYRTVNWLGWYKDCLPEVSYCGEAMWKSVWLTVLTGILLLYV